MDTHRAFLAIVLSFIILVGYQYFFIGKSPETPPPPTGTEEETPPMPQPPVSQPAGETMPTGINQTAPPNNLSLPSPAKEGRDIVIDTKLFQAVITETGGGVKSFKLKEYKETLEPDSQPVELVKTDFFSELPLYFTWGAEPARSEVPVYSADRDSLRLAGLDREGSLTLKANLSSGIDITRKFVFDDKNYLIKLAIDIHNTSPQSIQGAPYLSLVNRPFTKSNSGSYLFSGPAVLIDDDLKEIKTSDLEKETKTMRGRIVWTAYEGTYFMTGIIPEKKENSIVRLQAVGDKISTLLSNDADIIPSQGHKQYNYTLFFGPKKLSILKQIDADLQRIVNFGWFDILAKPTLVFLNFLYGFVKNYGVAIILVTVLIKVLFWPIAQKGMKSMKNMQKVQPKINKIREKYKNDPTRMNQEMMNLYKTYKINPLGGCLPMILQIPVFFALYKVLLQAIELRHAPFMLWINDLSAPDRLWAGLNIPYLGGIPVLTLLMGGSMFLQQKMTPTPADPTQAKIMLFLPVIFTFMFLNFASGLVLYWFVNNLLSIGQQYMINRPKEA